MRVAKFHLEGLSPYSWSKPHDEPKLEKEGHDDYDKRTFLSKAHATEDGEACIPAMAFKFAIADAAKRLSIKIPGKRNATYSKNILSGLMCPEPCRLGIKVTELAAQDVYAHSTGVRGPGTRVWRRFPITPMRNWQTTLEVAVLDDEIPKEIVEKCVSEAGNLLGVGRFRPATGGFLGRWKVTKVVWN